MADCTVPDSTSIIGSDSSATNFNTTATVTAAMVTIVSSLTANPRAAIQATMLLPMFLHLL